jgi:hypothetical protein
VDERIKCRFRTSTIQSERITTTPYLLRTVYQERRIHFTAALELEPLSSSALNAMHVDNDSLWCSSGKPLLVVQLGASVTRIKPAVFAGDARKEVVHLLQLVFCGKDVGGDVDVAFDAKYLMLHHGALCFVVAGVSKSGWCLRDSIQWPQVQSSKGI